MNWDFLPEWLHRMIGTAAALLRHFLVKGRQ
jgi:hypothetical protein